MSAWELLSITLRTVSGTQLYQRGIKAAILNEPQTKHILLRSLQGICVIWQEAVAV